MKLLDKIANRLGYSRHKVRGFDGAAAGRLLADWSAPSSSADAELNGSVSLLRDRARDLERNNDIVQSYLGLLENNVVGSGGVRLQMKISSAGKLDELDNKAVSSAWEDWKRDPTVAGGLSFCEVENMALRRTAVDGGFLVRLIRNYPNKYRFALQLLEIDNLDLNFNEMRRDGSQTRFGIEYDSFSRPVALNLLGYHPGDNQRQINAKRVRVPASEIIHIFWQQRPNQSLGYSWLTPVMRALRDLGKWKEAYVVAARIAACKGFAITPASVDGYNGDAASGETLEMSPGMGLRLNPGEQYTAIDPAFPQNVFGEFNKAMKREIAAALRVSYNSLGSDLESVNYSSLRAGRIEEVEEYKSIQSWLISTLHRPVFEAWLMSALTAKAITNPAGIVLPLSKFDRFNVPSWKPRRWPWVDPLKDLQASVLAVEKGFSSRRQIIAENGGDIDEIFSDLESDERLAESKGLDFTAKSESANSAPSQPKEPDAVEVDKPD